MTQLELQAKMKKINEEELARKQSISFPLNPDEYLTHLILADNHDNWVFLGYLVCHAVAGVNIIPVKQFRKEPEEFVEGVGWTDSDEIKQLVYSQQEGDKFLLFPTHCHEEPRLYLPSATGKNDYSFPELYRGRDGWPRTNYYSSLSYGLQETPGSAAVAIEKGLFDAKTPNGSEYKQAKYRVFSANWQSAWFRYPQFATTHWKMILKQLRNK